jgi:hypothetical protein
MKISEIENAGRQWHKYIPIQSVRQLLSISIGYAVVVGFISLVLKDSDDSVPWMYLCIGAAAGAFPALMMALQQVFHVEVNSSRSVDFLLGKIDELLIFRGYRNAGLDSTLKTRYVSKLPAILNWNENEFAVEHQGAIVVVRGPRSSIAWLRNRLVDSCPV